MIKIGSTVVYGTQVCKIDRLETKTFGKVSRDYYALTPVFDDKNVIFVPTDNEALIAKMRKILSAEEIHKLIDSLPSRENIWIEDDKTRATEYKAILEKGDRTDIALVLKTLFEHKREILKTGKKLHTTDEIIFNRAEKVLYEEFALVLDIKREDVTSFIVNRIESKGE